MKSQVSSTPIRTNAIMALENRISLLCNERDFYSRRINALKGVETEKKYVQLLRKQKRAVAKAVKEERASLKTAKLVLRDL